MQLLNNSNHLVKCHSLSLLGELTSLNNFQGENVKLICRFTKSQDPRVRTAAYNALVTVDNPSFSFEQKKTSERTKSSDYT